MNQFATLTQSCGLDCFGPLNFFSNRIAASMAACSDVAKLTSKQTNLTIAQP